MEELEQAIASLKRFKKLVEDEDERVDDKFDELLEAAEKAIFLEYDLIRMGILEKIA